MTRKGGLYLRFLAAVVAQAQGKPLPQQFQNGLEGGRGAFQLLHHIDEHHFGEKRFDLRLPVADGFGFEKQVGQIAAEFQAVLRLLPEGLLDLALLLARFGDFARIGGKVLPQLLEAQAGLLDQALHARSPAHSESLSAFRAWGIAGVFRRHRPDPGRFGVTAESPPIPARFPTVDRSAMPS